MKYPRGGSPSNKLYDSIRMLEHFSTDTPKAAAALKIVIHVLKDTLADLNAEEMAVIAARYPHPER